MSRPSQATERRKELLPIIARAFAELGYRRTTTAELGKRCRVRENVLYRLFFDKKAMFIAAIGYVYDHSVTIWHRLLEDGNGDTSPAERLLAHESRHHGEFGLYRIVFAGLSETDDEEIQKAIADMYERYQRFLVRQIRVHRGDNEEKTSLDATLTAWAVIGLGTVASIGRELALVSDRQRRRLLSDGGRVLLDG